MGGNDEEDLIVLQYSWRINNFSAYEKGKLVTLQRLCWYIGKNGHWLYKLVVSEDGSRVRGLGI